MEYITGKFIKGAFESLQGGRPENQDDCGFIDTPIGSLLVVCDGMGGGPGGKTASYIAKKSIIDTILSFTDTNDARKAVKQSIENANADIYSTACTTPGLMGMGSTAVVLLINKHSAIIGHVGDSRFYKLRGGSTLFRTADHSVVGDMVRRDILTEEQARLSTQSNMLTRSVGVRLEVEVDIDEIPYEKGDRFVLCTDGVWGSMPNKQLEKLFCLKKNISVLVEYLASHVDDIGKQNGGRHDNLTLAIVETTTNSIIKEKMSKKNKIILSSITIVAVISIIGNFIQMKKGNEISELKEQVEILTSDMQDKDSVLNNYKDSVQSLKTRTENSTDAIKKSQERLDELKEENENLKRQNVEQEAKIKKLENDASMKQQQQQEKQKKDKLKQDAKRALENLKNATSNNFPQLKKTAVNALRKAGFNDLATSVNNMTNKNSVQTIINKIK